MMEVAFNLHPISIASHSFRKNFICCNKLLCLLPFWLLPCILNWNRILELFPCSAEKLHLLLASVFETFEWIMSLANRAANKQGVLFNWPSKAWSSYWVMTLAGQFLCESCVTPEVFDLMKNVSSTNLNFGDLKGIQWVRGRHSR